MCKVLLVGNFDVEYNDVLRDDEVVEAASIQDAEHVMKNGMADVIVVKEHMRDGSASEFLRMWRNRIEERHPQVMVLGKCDEDIQCLAMCEQTIDERGAIGRARKGHTTKMIDRIAAHAARLQEVLTKRMVSA